MKKRDKKAQILMENTIFMVLNLIYLAILLLFIFSRGSGALVIEETYAKQIALIIDSAKPTSIIYLNMEDAIEITKDKWGEDNLDKMVSITGNVVTVQTSKDSGYSYSFFNDVEIGQIEVDADDKGITFGVFEK